MRLRILPCSACVCCSFSQPCKTKKHWFILSPYCRHNCQPLQNGTKRHSHNSKMALQELYYYRQSRKRGQKQHHVVQVGSCEFVGFQRFLQGYSEAHALKHCVRVAGLPASIMACGTDLHLPSCSRNSVVFPTTSTSCRAAGLLMAFFRTPCQNFLSLNIT